MKKIIFTIVIASCAIGFAKTEKRDVAESKAKTVDCTKIVSNYKSQIKKAMKSEHEFEPAVGYQIAADLLNTCIKTFDSAKQEQIGSSISDLCAPISQSTGDTGICSLELVEFVAKRLKK